MSTPIKEVNEMFRQGKYDEAFLLAQTDYNNDPTNVWEQRKMGWAYTYMMKKYAEDNDIENFTKMFDAFLELPDLSYQNDQTAFDNLLWGIIKFPFSEDAEHFFYFWQKLKNITFVPTQAYSVFLSKALKFKEFPYLQEFIEWWNLDNLRDEDYSPCEIIKNNGKKLRLMSLAEQVYITYAKCLLQKNDIQKISDFEPKLEALADSHSEMMYPGYYCGKLLLAMDADSNETLKRIIPFVRRKSRDFWVWQLLAEVFDDDIDKQMACFYRAASCGRDENFLVRLRTNLAKLLAGQNDYPRAKFQIDTAIKTYQQNDWRIPYALQELSQQQWYQTTESDRSAPNDFMAITNKIIGLKFETKQEQTIEGKVTSNKAKTIFFVTTTNGKNAIVPQKMVEKLKLADKIGTKVKATVKPSFDTKRGKNGLACTSIEKIYFNELNYTTKPIEIPRIENTNIHYEYDEDLPF